MALTGERSMMVEAPNLNLSYEGETTGLYTAVGDGLGSWQYDKHLGFHFWWYTAQISLDAFFHEKLSLQLEGVAMQKGYDPVVLYTDAGGVNHTPKGRVNLQYYVSTTPPWVDQLGRQAWMTGEATGATNTFGNSSKYYNSIPYQQCQVASNTTYSANSNVGLSSRGFLSVLNRQMFGSNNEIAGKKLYVTFFWIIEDETTAGLAPYPTGVAYIPALRLVLGGTVYKPQKGGWTKDLLRNTNIEPKLR